MFEKKKVDKCHINTLKTSLNVFPKVSTHFALHQEEKLGAEIKLNVSILCILLSNKWIWLGPSCLELQPGRRKPCWDFWMFKLETFTLKFLPPPPLPRAPQECTFLNHVDGFLHVSNPNSTFWSGPPRAPPPTPPVRTSYLTVFPEGDLSVTYSGALYEAAPSLEAFGRGCERQPPPMGY